MKHVIRYTVTLCALTLTLSLGNTLSANPMRDAISRMKQEIAEIKASAENVLLELEQLPMAPPAEQQRPVLPAPPSSNHQSHQSHDGQHDQHGQEKPVPADEEFLDEEAGDTEEEFAEEEFAEEAE